VLCQNLYHFVDRK